MDDTLKQRVVGLCILVFLAVVFVPFIFDGKGLQQKQSSTQTLDLPTLSGGHAPERTEQYTTVLTLDKPTPKPTTVTRLETSATPSVASAPKTLNPPQPIKRLVPLPLLPKKSAPPKQTKAKSTVTKPVKPTVSKPVAKTKTGSKNRPASSVKSGWLVQVGGFSNKKNATGLKKKLEKQGFKVFIKTNGAGNFFRVRVGVYASKQKALSAREKLAKLHKVKPILVKYP